MNIKKLREKITIGHLAPYLPYNLKGIAIEINQGIETIISLSKDNISTDIDDINYDDFNTIFHPRTDLLKPISINGGKEFVPMLELFQCDIKEEENFYLYGEIPECWKSLLAVKFDDWAFKDIKMLLKWHFWIFDQAEFGKSIIDINTL